MIARIKHAFGEFAAGAYLALKQREDGAWVPIHDDPVATYTAAKNAVLESLARRLRIMSESILRQVDRPERTDRVVVRGRLCEVDGHGAISILELPAQQPDAHEPVADTIEQLGEPKADEPGVADRVAKPGGMEVISYDDALRNVELDRCSTAGEAVIVALIFLLQRHHQKIGGLPSWRIINAALTTFQQVQNRSELPEGDHHDMAVLATYLGILRELSGRFDQPFVKSLSEWIERILHKDPSSDRKLFGKGRRERGSS